MKSPEGMAELLATPEALRWWLSSLPPESIAGVAGKKHDHPLVQFLVRTGAAGQALIIMNDLYWTTEADTYWDCGYRLPESTLPLWVALFIIGVGTAANCTLYFPEITAQECLTLLTGISSALEKQN